MVMTVRLAVVDKKQIGLSDLYPELKTAEMKKNEQRFQNKPKLRVISLGAGVQSSVMALLASRGELKNEKGEALPPPDYAIFADTGWEPEGVYKHLEWLKTEISKNKHPFEVVIAINHENKKGLNRSWKIQEHLLEGKNSTGQNFMTIPAFILNKKGKKSIARRQCTREYKLEPIYQKIRKLCGLEFGQRMPKDVWIEQWIGISEDEMIRMKDSRISWLKSCWPLVDMRIKREDCIKWFAQHYPNRVLPRSACIGCPMHTDKEWMNMKKDDPKSWKEAVKIDSALRTGSRKEKFDGEIYLHRSMTPLDKIDFEKTKDEKQVSLLDECEGMCGM